MLLRLLPSPRRRQGAGRGVGSLTSPVTSGAVLRRKNVGVEKPFKADVGVPSSPIFLFCGVTKLSSKNLLPADKGVFSPLALDSSDASLSALRAYRFGVWRLLCVTSASTLLLLLGVSAGSRSNKPSTIPSRCGVGPMIAGPCGDRDLSTTSVASGNSTPESRFLFIGVIWAFLYWTFGVSFASRAGLRLGARFDGVCGAVLLARMSRILLYSLYF
jgi:hypothetical protein